MLICARQTIGRLLVLLGSTGLVTMVGGCTGDERHSLLPTKLERDLTLGSQGPDVQAVQEYLMRYGYLPNEKLAREYPRWRPIVPNRPEKMGHYDAFTRRAVRAAQTLAGLKATGIVDAPTRQLLRTPRCGVPDGMLPFDARDKFDLQGSKWSGTNITWRYKADQQQDDLSEEAVVAQIEQAFQKWADVTNLTFTQVGSNQSAIATLLWADWGNDASIMTAFFPSDGKGQIRIHTEPRCTPDDLAVCPWTLAGSEAGKFDFQTSLVHEIGHVLGLNHSSVAEDRNDTAMTSSWYVDFRRRNLGSDDIFAVSLLYNPFEEVAGVVKDIGVGDDHSVWGIDTYDYVYKLDADSGWVAALPHQMAKAIAVDDDGLPWVVALDGRVLRHTTSSASVGAWEEPVPGACAKDIAASRRVWIVTCDDHVAQWDDDEGEFVWESTGFTASRIAVEDTGRPWIVQSDGKVYRRDTISPYSGEFLRVGEGWFFGPNADIGVGSNRTFAQAWVTDTNVSPPDLWAWNEQPGDEDDPIFNHPRKSWVKMEDTKAIRVSVDLNNPWIITPDGYAAALTKRPELPSP